MSRASVELKLKKMGYPVRLYKGKGYFYFIYDDQDRAIFESYSVFVCHFTHMEDEMWLEIGEKFCKTVKGE